VQPGDSFRYSVNRNWTGGTVNNLFFARSQIGMSLAFYIIFAAMLGCGRSTIVTSLPLSKFSRVKKSGDAI
jgi:hypothetical protein